MHRVRGIRQPEVRERIAQQDVAEVVASGGRRRGMEWPQRKPQRDGQDSQQQHAPTAARGQLPEDGFQAGHLRKRIAEIDWRLARFRRDASAEDKGGPGFEDILNV